MNKITKAISAFAVALLFAGAAETTTSHAESTQPTNLMSYAPQDEFNTERFRQFDFEQSPELHEENHELNDAWLGISAYSKDGVYLGYIEDAILNQNGDVTELVILPPEGDIAVQLQAEYAILDEDRVDLQLSEQEFASILTNGQVVASLD